MVAGLPQCRMHYTPCEAQLRVQSDSLLKRRTSMVARFLTVLLALFLLPVAPAVADSYADTIKIFKNAGESGSFFNTAYGYAVFPTVGKGGVGIGGAYGKGKVYEKGKYIGDT